MRRLLALVAVVVAGHVHGASLESLVMPGPVAAAHADIEDNCGACHAPFSKGSQSTLCLDCHEDVAADMTRARGFHGTGGRLADRECRACHAEHKGRDGDIVGLVPEAFDHTLTGFELTGRHAEAACQDCHQPDQTYRDVDGTCSGCHAGDDVHRGNLGSDCRSCHDTADWRAHSFDHARSTGFVLRGGHDGPACEACHAGQSYQQTPTECATCHALDDVHQGTRGSDCASCHNDTAWTEARFDHRAETGFALAGAHADLACAGCHLDAMKLKEPPSDCVGCHSADDVHLGQRGPDCAGCHRQTSWDVQYDHRAETGFALLGAHEDLACDACHRGSLDAGLPTDCEGCHEADDPHGGSLTACTDCHGPQSWSGPLRFDHEFTSFPLLGLHRLAACEQCHVTLSFHDAGGACVDCHRSDDSHGGSLGEDCSGCHTPSGWQRWQFDHARQTSFTLEGAHADLACASCHLPGHPDPLTVSSSCVSCHQGDDVHNGQFGARCARCHTTTTFSDTGRMF